MKLHEQLKNACDVIGKGGIVAYPTEAVFGLGCDPMNEQAVLRLSEIKQRVQDKSYILIGDDFSRLHPFCAPIDDSQWQRVKQDWPGPYTWVFPATELCPHWLGNKKTGIAVRVTAHPVAASLCNLCGHALVSTSANLGGEPPAKTWQEVEAVFKDTVDYIVRADVSDPHGKPTMIRDAIRGGGGGECGIAKQVRCSRYTPHKLRILYNLSFNQRLIWI